MSLLDSAIDYLLDDAVTLTDDAAARDAAGRARLRAEVARRELRSLADRLEEGAPKARKKAAVQGAIDPADPDALRGLLAELLLTPIAGHYDETAYDELLEDLGLVDGECAEAAQ